MNKHNLENIDLYSSFKANRDNCSVLSAELFVLIHAVDYALTRRKAIFDMSKIEVSMMAFKNSKRLYNALTGIRRTPGMRLLIDLTMH